MFQDVCVCVWGGKVGVCIAKVELMESLFWRLNATGSEHICSYSDSPIYMCTKVAKDENIGVYSILFFS